MMITYKSLVLPLVSLVLILGKLKCDDKYRYENWKFHFIPGTGIGIFLAVAVPLELPNKNVYLAYNFEANYPLPGNETSFEYPPLIERSIDRKLVYSALETKMNTSGYPGKECLLRTICECSVRSVQHNNGVLGDILHIIFTPSSSNNTGLPTEYELAEIQGRKKNDCTNYNKNCSVSFMDLITWIEKSV